MYPNHISIQMCDGALVLDRLPHIHTHRRLLQASAPAPAPPRPPPPPSSSTVCSTSCIIIITFSTLALVICTTLGIALMMKCMRKPWEDEDPRDEQRTVIPELGGSAVQFSWRQMEASRAIMVQLEKVAEKVPHTVVETEIECPVCTHGTHTQHCDHLVESYFFQRCAWRR